MFCLVSSVVEAVSACSSLDSICRGTRSCCLLPLLLAASLLLVSGAEAFRARLAGASNAGTCTSKVTWCSQHDGVVNDVAVTRWQ